MKNVFADYRRGVWEGSHWYCQCRELSSNARSQKFGGRHAVSTEFCKACGDQRPAASAKGAPRGAPDDNDEMVPQPLVIRPGMVIRWPEGDHMRGGVVIAAPLYAGKMRVGERSIAEIQRTATGPIREVPPPSLNMARPVRARSRLMSSEA